MSLKKIIKLMKSEEKALGFIPITKIEKQNEKGLVFHQYINGEWAGYLVVGAINYFQVVHIWQECLDKSARGTGEGKNLFYSLLKKCKEKMASAIILRCAQDLDSNYFWQSLGFEHIKTVNGGKKRKRIINIYKMELLPTLFDNVGERKLDNTK